MSKDLGQKSGEHHPLIISAGKIQENVSEKYKENVTFSTGSQPPSVAGTLKGSDDKKPHTTTTGPLSLPQQKPGFLMSQQPSTSGPLILGRNHSRSRQARLDMRNLKMKGWSVVLLTSLVIVAAYLFMSEECLNTENTLWKIADFCFFFLLLFMLSRFLTTTAVIILILSVAAFHVWDQVHYQGHDPNKAYLKKHARYFAAMFVCCLISLKVAPYLSDK